MSDYKPKLAWTEDEKFKGTWTTGGVDLGRATLRIVRTNGGKFWPHIDVAGNPYTAGCPVHGEDGCPSLASAQWAAEYAATALEGAAPVEIPEGDPQSDAEQFLAEIAAACRRHGLCLTHEDYQGQFHVEALTDYALSYLLAAKDVRCARCRISNLDGGGSCPQCDGGL